ncbi:MAG: TetR/AcrR family transcriptional regulator [Geobacteraceae bacterium]|jgi:TetR/AcrR family transcriptional repressor of nem operon
MATKGDITREKILEAARYLFNTKGFGATSINDLVDASGLQKGSICFHFPGKDAIGLTVLEEARNSFMDFLADSLTGDSPGLCLENFFGNVMEKHLATGFVGGCIFGNTALEMGDSDKRYAEIIDQVFDQWIGKIEKIVVAAQEKGELRNDIPGNALARNIVAVIEGGIMMSRVKKDEVPLRECLEVLRKTLDLK